MIDLVIGKDDFSEELATSLNTEMVKVESKTFSDREIRPRLLLESENQIKGKDALLVVRSNRYIPSPNDSLTETYLLLKEIKELGAKRIRLLWPWALYSRQDEKFRPGEPLSLKRVAELLEFCGVRDYYTIHSHIYKKPVPLKEFFSTDVNVHDISPAEVFVEHFKQKDLKDCLVVVPDEKGRERAREIAEPLNCEIACLSKIRDPNTAKIKIYFGDLNVRGRNLIILDDVSSSGETLAETYNGIIGMEPRGICIAVYHLVNLDAIKKLYDLRAEEIITTNSFANESGQPKYFTELNIVPLIANYLKSVVI
jgi:ribose-phosphate pyrophosphokinase